MKSAACFVSGARLSRNRGQILELLGGDEAKLQMVEMAVADYLTFETMLVLNKETEAQIHEDLRQLAQAVSTMQRIYKSRGRAKALFSAEAASMAGGYTILKLSELFGNDAGECLLLAANQALDTHHVKRGSPPDDVAAERRYLVARVSYIAGMPISRQDRDGRMAPFNELMEAIYSSVGIDTKPEADCKAILDIEKARNRVNT